MSKKDEKIRDLELEVEGLRSEVKRLRSIVKNRNELDHLNRQISWAEYAREGPSHW